MARCVVIYDNSLKKLFMCELEVSVPDERLAALNVPAELAAVKLYEMGRLSTGAAAEFAGIPSPSFLRRGAN